MKRHAEFTTKPTEGVEITWRIDYAWSRPIPATYYSPAEGGLELDGEPWPVAVTWYPYEAPHLSVGDISEGSILALWLIHRYGLPPVDDWYAAIDEDWRTKHDEDQELRAEARDRTLRGDR